jgi:hypothetical protein
MFMTKPIALAAMFFAATAAAQSHIPINTLAAS